MYAVTVETPRPEQGRHTHLLSYIWKLATRGGKEHFMYAVTVETLRSGQARHAHISSYRGNLKNVYACVLQYRSGARSYRENPNNVYVRILYSRISARRTFTYLKWQPQLVVSVTYHPRVRTTKFYVLSFPAIWWRSMKIQCGSVTETYSVTVYIRWLTACWGQNVEAFEGKATT
jgi:hypothetical protein